MLNSTSNSSNYSNYYSFFNTSNDTMLDDDYNDIDYVEKIFSIVVPILFSMVVLVGLFGNALVVIVVLYNQQMRNTTNLLIINLAVADLLFICCCVPFTACDYALPYWYFGEIWCEIVQYLIIVCAYASVYTLVLMSFDRFLAVVYPIDAMRVRTERNAIIAILALWTIILLSCIPALLSHGLLPYDHRGETYYACTFLKDEYNSFVFQIIFFLTSYLIPVALICGLYLVMLKKLWHGATPGSRSCEDNRRKRRATQLVVVVVVIFVACWGPIQIVLVLKSVDFYSLTTTNVVVQILSQIFAYVNSCVNPILYAFLSDSFKAAFHKVISCGSTQTTCRNNSKKNELKSLNKSSRYISNDTEITNALV